MKKIFILIALIFVTSVCTFAQSSLIATLSHNGTYRAFYGSTALREAHEAAVDGDVITLSGGTFSSVNITKAISLRGAGMLPDAEKAIVPTVIQGSMQINIADTTRRFVIEGMKFLDNVSVIGGLVMPSFQKCLFTSVYSSSAVVKQGVFYNCYITTSFSFYNGSTVTFINSYISESGYTSKNTNSKAMFDFQNCVIKTYGSYTYDPYFGLEYIKNSTFTNCVIIGSNDYVSSLSSSNFCYNCVSARITTNIFSSVAGTNNRVVSDVTTLMKEFTGTNYYDGISFALTDDAATTYLGTDGTQVGMFGGMLPFDPMPNTLQITKCNVASKSTVDGKLSVEIEVSGVE